MATGEAPPTHQGPRHPSHTAAEIRIAILGWSPTPGTSGALPDSMAGSPEGFVVQFKERDE